MTHHIALAARACAAITIVSLGALTSACSGAADPTAAGGGSAEATSEARSLDMDAWTATMHQTRAPRAGCFTASFPSTEWEEVGCVEAPAYRSRPAEHNLEDVIGNGSDFVAQAPSGAVFSSVVGSFPTVTGVKTEKSVGVPAFGGGGILGANEYTVQVNTNFYHSAACGSFSKCLAWQQYVMSTNTPVSLTGGQLTGDTEVFIEYWLIDYGSNSSASCPSGFINAGADASGPGVDCVQNTPAALIATGQLPISNLKNLKLSATAVGRGTDAATVTLSGKAYTATVTDSLTDISAGWTLAEFNIFGNAGGSRAKFNTGSDLTVNLALTDGSTAAPKCLAPSARAGTTGETNNLNAGPCTATGGASPSIQFTESN